MSAIASKNKAQGTLGASGAAHLLASDATHRTEHGLGALLILDAQNKIRSGLSSPECPEPW